MDTDCPAPESFQSETGFSRQCIQNFQFEFVLALVLLPALVSCWRWSQQL